MFKSAPQQVLSTFTNGIVTVDAALGVAVDLNHSVILYGGVGTPGVDSSGFVSGSQFAFWSFGSSSIARASRNQSNEGVTITGTVLEFFGGFLRQNVQQFIVPLGTTAHGMTLGAKAFPVFAGWDSDKDSISSDSQSIVLGNIKIDGTNIYFTGNGGSTIFGSVFIVDPR